MSCFSWLHLTDLHQGMQEQNWLWPSVKEVFFKDLESLHEKCGPWDLVLFTGDLTQRGSKEEFNRIDDILEELWTHLKKLGSSPQLLAVPGNHDLVRPNFKDPCVRLLKQWPELHDIQEEFWEEADSPYRQVVTTAFKNYAEWWEKQPFRARKLNEGILPGDFSFTFEKEQAKLGVLGLNTSFLQLTSDDYEGKLAIHARQFHQACSGNGVDWAKQHHVCLLLTHHPPSWLTTESKQDLRGEIVAHGRFAAHLCGHMHDVTFQDISEGGTEARRVWQGRSLFGLEYLGSNKDVQRLHGYTAGRIELSDKAGQLIFWPRQALLQGGQRKIAPDYTLDLTDDQHIKPRSIELLQPYDVLKRLKEEKDARKKKDSESLKPRTSCYPMDPDSRCLEGPRGSVPLKSVFYIERPEIESLCYQEITNRAALIHIRTPLDMGKTTLLIRILDYAKQQSYKTILISLERFEENTCADLNLFLRRFCALVSRSLGISPKKIDDYWDEDYFGPNDNCMDFFEQCILPSVEEPLVMALDDVDVIFPYQRNAKEFLKLIRVWHEQAKTNNIWSKLRLVLAYSTELYIEMDTHSSPFNVGIEINLPEFTSDQVLEIARRCGLDWNDTQVDRLMSLVGGHPYLIRVALHQVAYYNKNLDLILQSAPTEGGIYGNHLRRHLRNLQQHPELLSAMSTVVNSEHPVCLDAKAEFNLHAMGLVDFDGNEVRPRSELYRRYFRKRLKEN
ncbi:MAG: AAA-like domain-containing protein [Synechococcus sp.]